MSLMKIAHLEKEQAHRVHDLEQDLDVCILALEPGLEIAQLSDEQLAKVQQVEKELKVTLVVYKKC